MASPPNFNQFVENALLTRAALLGSMTNTGKDINTECGYPETITTQQYKDMYDREGIATRVVEVLPQESWAMNPEITENEDSEETTFEMAWKTLDDDKRVFHYLQRADELSGIGSFGILLLGVDDGKELHEPVEGVEGWTRPKNEDEPEQKPSNRLSNKPEPASPVGNAEQTKDSDLQGKEQNTIPDSEEPAEPFNAETELLYMRVFDESLVSIVKFEQDKANPRFGQPVLYDVTFADENTAKGLPSTNTDNRKQVHWTRVIHIADNRKSSEVFGVPRQRSVYNRLVDLRKLLGGSAEMFWKGAFPGYSFEVDGDSADIEIDAASMREEFENYSQGLQRYLALAGVSAKSLAPQVANPQSHVQAELEAIAITLGVPVRIFTGSEQAHLASSTDETTWNRRVNRRRENYLGPMVIRPTVERFMAMGILPEVSTLTVDWEDLNAPSDADKAEVVAKVTKALADYIAGSVDQIIPPREYLIGVHGMDPDEVDEILLAAEAVIEEEELKEEEERQAMQERAEAMGMEAQAMGKDGPVFGQPVPPPIPPQNGSVPAKKPAFAK